MLDNNIRFKKAQKITIYGAVINILLGILKVIGGYTFNSHALIADGIHSFSDLLIDTLVLIASKYGSQAADDSHPYGHQKIETAATMLLAMLLILAGAGISWDSLNVIINYKPQTPGVYSLPIVILSIITNELLFHITHKIGKNINSPLLIANAWHHRSDAASSVIVLLGIIGALFGFKLLDPLAAILIGTLIIKMGINYAWNSIKELVDTSVDQTTLATVEEIIKNIHGVKRIHQLRSRMMGKDMFIDVHILVSPFISVSEGHHIAQTVHKNLLDNVTAIKDVTIHVDPEDDEKVSPSISLPNRQKLENDFLNKWQKQFPAIKAWTIHYLDGYLTIDINIANDFNNFSGLEELIKKDISKQQNISIINLLINHTTIDILHADR